MSFGFEEIRKTVELGAVAGTLVLAFLAWWQARSASLQAIDTAKQAKLSQEILEQTKIQLASQNVALLFSNIDLINSRFMEVGEDLPIRELLQPIPEVDHRRSAHKAVMTLYPSKSIISNVHIQKKTKFTCARRMGEDRKLGCGPLPTVGLRGQVCMAHIRAGC